MTRRTIDFHYDLLSPFAHVALKRMAELPEDVTVRPVPVLLGAILAHWGQRGPAEISAKRLHTYRLSVFLGRKHGLDMRFPPRHPFNPLKALRLLAGSDADLATVQRGFNFVFEQGRAPDTDEELSAFAEATGLPVSLAGDEAAKAALRANTERAIERGVFGVPSFVCPAEPGHAVFWGVDAFDMLLAWLDDEMMFDREPYRHLDAVTIGIERK
ncbi:MAG: 2-hydroxychromene-2-carboxylate isomerase [Hoeflea sp.]|uniref:2-hydroxychromene-2-carboxylate isomerase n=1 Tax=Hoeflea sp. TaxID=1940281 RepID=UPI001D4CE2A8|nr:2-hydroxychromene-2-carboxylate isomerase [Hoeflea sp.]MBU4531603.1 2-hydroxychromene-2-carboxylate isomerase [Alphaproteobacteria bacterium]MBU4544460.1 2-hydroxychromene-2-carboxylate isomerase [Alphaproteobacteria bacterium]MBU4552691.1 2-hydroxychromene-2-carboxylate isomerase [Alphaproteobacteria bacterium]MBV1724879.1 2-hydroxychromene-2-carboxylate isomerase [Hoeflea sp.]MBV1760899.1 2-hydroxychromene-2-carboxylate isomerase [Hoeflea sp.]